MLDDVSSALACGIGAPFPMNGGLEHEPDTGGKILIVDDEPAARAVLGQWLIEDGHAVLHAASGEEALRRVASVSPDLVLMNLRMPGLGGLDVCRRIKENRATRLVPVVLITERRSRAERISGFQSGADELLSRPVNRQELRVRVRSLIRLKRYAHLESPYEMILILGMTVEARDPTTEGHCQRLAEYALDFADHVGLSAEERRVLRLGAYLHDIGKVGVPDALLRKAGPLSPEEFVVVKQHVIIGDTLCCGTALLRAIRPIVRWHHERLDGSGYPDGLRGDEIPLLAQMVSIVDAYDALTTDRPYQKAMSPARASEILRMEVQRGWRQHELVELFLASRGSI